MKSVWKSLEGIANNIPACLKERRNEFLDATGIKTSKDGEEKNSLFYRVPYSSCQKLEVEHNQELFRFFSPKSYSLKDYNQEEMFFLQKPKMVHLY